MTETPAGTSDERGLVYVHGAGLNTWIWEELTPLVSSPQLTPTFPAREEEQTPSRDLRLRDYVEHVIQQIEQWGISEIVLVGHSIGGVVSLGVADELSDKVVGFVGISAAIPAEGGSFVSSYPFHQRIVQQAIMRFVGTKPPASVVRRSLCNDLAEEYADRLAEEFVPESRRLYTDRIKAQVPDVPTFYVKTTADNEISPSLQDRMIENLHAEDVVEIDAGHMPMLGCSQEVAGALERFGVASTA